jgi:hypothetical protein
MNNMVTEQHRALQKIKVTCKTCGVSESFYSNLSVEKFKARHSGHEVFEGDEQVAPPKAREETPAPSGDEEIAPPKAREAPKELKPLARGAGTKVAKVIVDLLDFPSLDNSIVRIRGFDADLDEVFTATLSSVEIAKIRGMFAAGEYLDSGASGLLYVWEPDVVEYIGDIKEKVGLTATTDEAQTEEAAAQLGPEPSESEEVIDQATVASAAEVLIDALSGEEAAQADEGIVSASLSPLSDPSENFEEFAPSSPPQSTRERQPEPELTEVRIPSPPAPSSPDEKKTVERASIVASAHPTEANEDDYLLVSKSWYIQGGKGNRKEAVRVSKVLKAFRWKVEPVYTIGVILDDMLSIETGRGQISGTLINGIEGAGYRLTAVAIDQGKPIAWFKKEGSAMHSLHADSVAADLDDSEIELEQDVTG